MASIRLAIVQDYVPLYRVEFFNRLVEALEQIGIECVVCAGPPNGAAEARRDAFASATWLREIGRPCEIWPVASWPRFFGYGTDRHWRDCDGVIMGLRGAAFDLSLELLRKRRTLRRVGVWGHLSRSVRPPNRLDLAVERWQMKRSDHVFAYTEEGRAAAVSAGIPAVKVTAVMNSLDVADLTAAYAAISEVELRSFCAKHSLVEGKTFGFVGGIDAGKRIDFLVDVLERVWERDRDVKFVIAGRGEQQGLLEPAIRRGQVTTLGYGHPREKAMLMRVSQALVNPGRVGLIAVESLAVGIPVLTTDWELHAPEIDYLSPGVDVLVSPDAPEAFVSLLLEQVSQDRTIRRNSARPYPGLDEMVQNFVSGIGKMFD